jgi:hypothetical protein
MKVAKLAHNFRTHLFMEHFGIDYDQASNPFACIESIEAIAKKNSDIFDDVFKCEPSNRVKSFKEVTE